MNIGKIITRFSMDKLSFKNKRISGNTKFLMPCIGYVLKGAGRFLYNGNVYIANSGDLIYIAAGTRYYSTWSGEPDIEFYSINYSFSAMQTLSEYRFQIIENYPSELLHEIYSFCKKDDFLCMSAFYRLLDDLYENLISTRKNSASKTITPALEYLEKHPEENISIPHLASICCCSESSLFKLFREITGVSPIRYKHNIMIQKALRLLADTDLSIEEISRECGFSSSNYFRKIFIRLTEKTPKEFRKK